MTPAELAADVISRHVAIVNMTLADFSDADLLARPVPGANHAAWQVGHLVGGLYFMFDAAAPGVLPAALAPWCDRCSGKTANVDDPAHYGTKAHLLEALAQAHAAVVAWAKNLAPADLDKPTPAALADFAPTLGHLLHMASSHLAMHIGQMQVIRRKLNKPHLF